VANEAYESSNQSRGSDMKRRLVIALGFALGVGCALLAMTQSKQLPPLRYALDSVIDGNSPGGRIVRLRTDSDTTRLTWRVFPGQQTAKVIGFIGFSKAATIGGPLEPGNNYPAVKLLDKVFIIEPKRLVVSGQPVAELPPDVREITFEETHRMVDVSVGGKSVHRFTR
jgi:hypothetical protein